MKSLHEDLTQHADFVVRLARSLSRPGDDAEGAAQEAMVAALRQSGGPEDSLKEPRAWLAKIVGRALTRERRGALRREDRERRVGQSESTGRTPVDQLAEIELGQKLLSHVRGLDSVYRDVLFQRYYEQKMPAEIAAELNVSLGTIKTRLARGLDLMRGRLDAEEPGGRRAWLSAAVTLGGSGGRGLRGVSLVKAAEVGGTPVWVLGALVAVVLGLGLLGLSALSSGDAPEVLTGDGQSDSALSMAEVPATAGQRQVIAPDVLPGKAARAAAGDEVKSGSISADLLATGPVSGLKQEPRHLVGFVRGFDGTPLVGAVVRGKDQVGGERRPLEATTDESGQFKLGPALNPFGLTAEYENWFQLNDYRPTRDSSGEFEAAWLLMAPRARLRVQARMADGSPASAAGLLVGPDPHSVGFHHGYMPFDRWAQSTVLGDSTVLEVPGGLPLLIWCADALLDRLVAGEARTFESDPEGSPILVEPGEEATVTVVLGTDAELRVAVIGADGKPQPEAEVTFAIPENATNGASASTFPFQGDPENWRARRVQSLQPSAEVVVRAWVPQRSESGARLTDKITVRLTGQSTKEVTLVLRPSRVTGTLVGPDGPIKGVVELTPSWDPSAMAVTSRSRKDGSFRFTYLEPGAYSVAAWSHEFARTSFGSVSPGGEPLALSLSVPQASHVRFQLELEDIQLVNTEVWWTPAGREADAPSTGAPFTAEAFESALGAVPFASPLDDRARHGYSRLTGDGASVDVGLTPGVYRFSVHGSFREDFRGGYRHKATDALASGWVEVAPGDHLIQLKLQPWIHASWEGRIQSARPAKSQATAGFRRLGVAFFRGDGTALAVASEGKSAVRFVGAGWQGRIFVDRIPVGTHEVWIGTEAQIESGEPLARHRVEFGGGVNGFELQY